MISKYLFPRFGDFYEHSLGLPTVAVYVGKYVEYTRDLGVLNGDAHSLFIFPGFKVLPLPYLRYSTKSKKSHIKAK